jgi:hypothetical protein
MDKNLFTNRLNQLGIKRQVDAAMVVSNAQKIINDKFGEQRGGDNLRAVSYRKGVLKIAASSNAWAAECQGLVGQIKTPPVERVVFVVGVIIDLEQ